MKIKPNSQVSSNKCIIKLCKNFCALVDYTSTPIICLTEDFDIIEINPTTAQLFNETKDNLVGANILSFCKLNNYEFNLSFDLLNKTEANDFYGFRCDISNHSATYPISWTCKQLYDHEAKEIGIILIGEFLFYSNHKGNDQNNFNTEKDKEIYLLKKIIYKLPGHIYWKDDSGKYLGSNEGNIISSGLKSHDDIIGKTDYDLFSKAHADRYRKLDLEVMRTGKCIVKEETGFFPDGTKGVFLSQKAPLIDEKNKIIGIVGNGIEVTLLKKTQEEMRIAKEKAEAANIAKQQFLANMEHDLKTPCIGIKQALHVLGKNETDLDKKGMLTEIAHAAGQLLEMLTDILEYSRTSNGKIPITREKFDIYQLVKDIVTIEEPIIETKNLRLLSTIDTNIPKFLIGDKHRTHRILLNLIGNATKFTEQGYIKIAVGLAKQFDAQRILVKLIIEDTGIGIPKDKQQEVFERFTRVSNANQRKYEGSGLGLNITKQFIEELGGTITMQSEINKGTTMTCLLPFELPATQPKILQAAETIAPYNRKQTNTQNLKILLVEDSRLIKIATSALINDNFTKNLDIAENGKEAISLAKKNNYDLIFMDIGLPDITGYQVTQQIRNIEKNKSVPVIALTAHHKEVIEPPQGENQIDDFVTKPLSIEKMQHIIEKWVVDVIE